ncbi:MAG: VWFA-related domain-containing protein [Acidobacteria bacterium OLB17]|nr:MAG: VWFA-related domain-containing protein [Acidobacteria bacterium OLB17]
MHLGGSVRTVASAAARQCFRERKTQSRPKPPTEEELRKAEEERKRAEEEKNAIFDPTVEKVATNIVSVEVTVINKKTGAVITGLKKENFAIFEDGKQQPISSFTTPDSPITVTVLVEFSKWSEVFGSAAGGIFEPGAYEVVRPAALFVSRFIKPPNDYASIVAFDIRPTPITDFTNDPRRLREAVDLLFRSAPAVRENNLWDALKFTILGGTSDPVVLENSKAKTVQYSGMASLNAPRKAIILVASGIDTFSKTSYDQARRIVQEAGIPVYVISTGNLFFKKYENYLGPMDDLATGLPGRLTFLQAQNSMNTIAKESGGMHFPMTFEGEIPDYLNSINALLRNQYNIAYDLTGQHTPGQRYKLQVKVDVNGDGIFDEKAYRVQARPYYIAPGGDAKDKKKEK